MLGRRQSLLIMDKLTPEQLYDIFRKLQEVNLEAVVVGGQAVNLYAYQYAKVASPLEQYMPFASEDLDFYGGKIEAMICQEILGGRVILNRDFDPSPNAGILLVDYQDKTLRIDFLASVYGLNDTEITGTALTFFGQDKLANIKLKVLHPLLCLEGKLRCLRGLPQQSRQDLKHSRIMVICLHHFLRDLILNSPARMVLNLMERVLNNAIREDGLSAWYHHQILLEDAIPLEILEDINDDKFSNFLEIRLPQIREQIKVKRTRYQQIMERFNN